uniref:PHD finger protein 20 n=1 Tax=Timema douglasi TaxID=61478 RepID=A0A7R8Z9G5_TIMDO|nr:unnamed protein product [Timema douglasi]
MTFTMKESRTRSSKSMTPTDTSQQAKMKGSNEKYKSMPEDNLVKSRILGENSSDLCVSPTKSEDSEQESLSSLAAGASTSIVEKHGQDESESGARHEGSGINFHPGLRLEAKDLGNDKYGVKVVEVDWVEEDVLIHFEKWSQRYDEWISMDSPRLRSPQKSEPQPESKPISFFNVGDEVMAAWTDNRRYPAKVKAVAPNNKFEVVFFDGFTKFIKGSKMHKLTEGELENMKEKIPSPLANEISLQTPAVYIRPKKINIFTDVSPEGIGSKEDRRQRKRKLNVAELFVSKKRRVGSFDFSPPRQDIERITKLDLGKQGKAFGNASSANKKESNQSFEDANQKDSSAPNDPTKVESKSESIGRSRRKSGQPVVTENGENKQSVKKAKIISGKARKRSRKLNFDEISTSSSKVSKDNESPRSKKKSVDPDNELEVGAKWEPEGDTAYVVESTAGLRRSIIIADPRLPSGWAKHTIQRRSGNSAGKWDVFLVGPAGRKFRTRAELRTYFEERKEPFEEALFDFGLGRRKLVKVAANSNTPALKPSSSSKVSRSSGKNKHSSSPIENATPQEPPLQRRIKTLLPKIRPPHSEGEKEEKSSADTEGPPPPYTTTVAANSAVKVPDPVDGQVFVGGLKIQMENDAYKCPKEGCGKTFRKENLLQMHLKHYHPEYNKFMGSTPNVADLAYARTIGENLEDLMPKSRFTFTTVTPFATEKSARIENTRKSRTLSPSDAFNSDKKKDKNPVIATTKKLLKGEQEEKPQIHEPGTEPAQCKPVEGVGEEMSLPSETTTSNTPLADVKEERKEPDNISKLPLSTSEQTTEMTTIDRPAEDCEDDHIDVVDDKDVQQPDSPQSSTCVSKVLRSVRKRQLSGPSPSPDATFKKQYISPVLHQMRVKRQLDYGSMTRGKLDLLDEGDGTEEGSCSLDGSKFSSTIRINKKKLPMIHLEKLNVTTDSNALFYTINSKVVERLWFLSHSIPHRPCCDCVVLDRFKSDFPRSRSSTVRTQSQHSPISVNIDDVVLVSFHLLRLLPQAANLHEASYSQSDNAAEEESKSPLEQSKFEHLRKEELINCTCGYSEEDGLMIQCDLCLCWQHGICNNIEKEGDVPEKYTCSICLNPYRERASKKYLHDQDWLKEGKLPSHFSDDVTKASYTTSLLIQGQSGVQNQNRNFKASKRLYKCNYCKKSGHKAADCWTKMANEKQVSMASEQTHAVAEEIVTLTSSSVSALCAKLTRRDDVWCVDSGATTHMCRDKNSFLELTPTISQKVSVKDPISNADGHVDKVQESDPIDPDRPIEVNENDLKSENLSKDCTVIENKRGPGRPKLIKTGKPGRPAKHFNLVTPKPESASLILSFHTKNPSDVNHRERLLKRSHDVTGMLLQVQHVAQGLRVKLNIAEKPDHPKLYLWAKSWEKVSKLEGLKTENDIKVEDKTECNEESDKFNKRDETSVTSSTEELSLRINDSEEMDENCIEPSKNTNQLDQSSNKMFNLDNTDSSVQPGVMETECETTSSANSKKVTDEGVEKDTQSEDLKSLLHDQGDLDLEPQQTDDTSNRVDGRADYTRPDSSLLHQALTNGATNQHDNMLQLPICQNELMHFASTMAGKLDATGNGIVQYLIKLPNSPQPEAPIDPMECRLALLDHIEHSQQLIDSRLSSFEAQVAALESEDPDFATGEADDYFPQTKQTVQMLLRDLLTMRRIASLN